MTQSTNELLKFVEFTNQFAIVKRDIYKNLTDGKENENDAEHSFQLAMVVWYLAHKLDVDLDLNKLIQYSLVHDLVETYAGDISAWDEEGRANKKEQEAKSLNRIKEEFPEFKPMTDLINKYENKEDLEAKFVNATDKLMPAINIMLDEGRFWKDNQKSLQELKGIKDSKISIDPSISTIWEDLKQELTINHDKYFNQI